MKNGISRQALFTVDNSRILYKCKHFRSTGLHFSIYNPRGSNLDYNVSIKSKNKIQNIFSRRFKNLELYKGYINLADFYGKKISIILETKGQGVGAWVNPVLTSEIKKPRIFVIIMLDTLRFDHTSLHGYHRDTTPFIAKLALDSVVYSNAYSTTSWTYPAHVSLFSGLDLVEHQILDQRKNILNDYPLIAEVFQKYGFLTIALTGGGFVSSEFGFHRGFRYYSNIPGSEFSPISSKRVFNGFKKIVEKYRGRNLFFFLHTYQMHTPYNMVPKSYIVKFNKNINRKVMNFKSFLKVSVRNNKKKNKKQEYRKKVLQFKFKKLYMSVSNENKQQLIDLYDASIFYADEVLVGGVINYLKQIGVYDESMIIVTSDHGEEFFDHGSWEHGHSLYNELIRIPLVIKYPQNNKKGIEDSLVSITDIPGIILKESGFTYKKDSFKDKIGEEKRILPIHLPISPLIKQISPKISFVNQDFHYIFNIHDEDKMKFFDPPPPKVPVYELYSTSDINEKNNFYMRGSEIARMFKKLQKKYFQLIKQINANTKGRKLDKQLEKKLKSLGYLGN